MTAEGNKAGRAPMFQRAGRPRSSRTGCLVVWITLAALPIGIWLLALAIPWTVDRLGGRFVFAVTIGAAAAWGLYRYNQARARKREAAEAAAAAPPRQVAAAAPPRQVAATGPFPASMRGRASSLIINYEGSVRRDVERGTIDRLAELLKPGPCRIMTYCNSTVPELKAVEAPCDMLINVNCERAGVGMETMVAYTATKANKNLDYPMERVGYWVGEVLGVKVHCILCLDQ